jgi:cytidylate kinase
MNKKLIVAIDGPAGSGKSSIGDMLAERLGYIHLSTGAIYRALGWKANASGIDFSDVPALERLIEETSIEFHRQTDGSVAVLLDGEDVSETIITNEVGMLASSVSAIPEVRKGLLSLQRKAGQGGGVILDGRDIGTVVFPDADAKFYLDASAEKRAKRRHLQLQEQGIESDLEQLVQDIRKRDYDDSTREAAPLRQAEDAVYIDSSSLSCEEVVERMLAEMS